MLSDRIVVKKYKYFFVENKTIETINKNENKIIKIKLDFYIDEIFMVQKTLKFGSLISVLLFLIKIKIHGGKNIITHLIKWKKS